MVLLEDIGEEGPDEQSEGSRTCIRANFAPVQTPGQAAGAERRRRRSSTERRRQSTLHTKTNHLQSEINVSEVVEHINFLQSCGVGFLNFSPDDVATVAEGFSCMTFDAAQPVVQEGR